MSSPVIPKAPMSLPSDSPLLPYFELLPQRATKKTTLSQSPSGSVSMFSSSQTSYKSGSGLAERIQEMKLRASAVQQKAEEATRKKR